MPEMRFTEFPVLFVDPGVEISRSASETDVSLFFLPMSLDVTNSYLLFIISHIFDILHCIMTFSERHSVF